MPYLTKPAHEAIHAALQAWAWPGGYPVYAVMGDGGSLCPKCVKEELRTVVRATHDHEVTESLCSRYLDTAWVVAGAEVNWEDPDLTCDHCYKPIESAYGEVEVQHGG